MLKASTTRNGRAGTPTARDLDRFQESLQMVARVVTQGRLHEQLLRSAGVRLDRAGAALLHKLAGSSDSLRITDLAEILGIDAPAVTRKVQQLEREGLVVRHIDPDDRRATRIRLTPEGRRTLERVLSARRIWLERLLDNWERNDLATLATLFGRFADELERDVGDSCD